MNTSASVSGRVPDSGRFGRTRKGTLSKEELTEDGARKGRMNARRRTPSLFDVPQGTVVTPTTSPASSTAAEAAQWAVAADTVTATEQTGRRVGFRSASSTGDVSRRS